jgi:hypothetical protein
MTLTDSPRLRMPQPVSALAVRLGWSEGDVWTLGIGLSLASLLAVTTIPAALTERSAVRTGAVGTVAAAPPPVVAAEPAPESDLPVPAPGAAPPVAPAPPLTPLLEAPSEPAAPVPAPPADPTAVPDEAGDPSAPLLGAVREFSSLPSSRHASAVVTTPDAAVHVASEPSARDEKVPPSAVLTLTPQGRLRTSSLVPDQPEARSAGITAIAPLGQSSLLLVDAATDRVLRYEPDRSAYSVRATIPDVPPCLLLTPAPCQPGFMDSPPMLRGIATDAEGTAYVSDAGQGTIWRLRPGQEPEMWYSSDDVAGEGGLSGLALQGSDALLVAVPTVRALADDSRGAVFRIERTADGQAGERTLVAGFQPEEQVVDVAVGQSEVYVALRGADAVAFLGEDGDEGLRVTDPRLAEPSSVEVVRGAVLVTTTRPEQAVLAITTKADQWRPRQKDVPTSVGHVR